MNLIGPLLVVVLIGAILPLQGLINARLGTYVGGPIAAAFVSFLLGTIMLGLYLLATRTPVTLQGSLKLPPWIWAGGFFGALDAGRPGCVMRDPPPASRWVSFLPAHAHSCPSNASSASSRLPA